MSYTIAVIMLLTVASGTEATKNHSRIVGGGKAKEPIPYQISLQVKVRKSSFPFLPFPTNDREWAHNCGGSIISENYILTAAHCVDGADPEKLSVVAGSLKRTEGGTRYLVESFTIHPEYEELKKCDIAVMKLKQPIEFSDTVSKIDFMDRDEIGGGVPCKLTGWGYTRPIRFGNLPEDLQTIDLKTLSNEECTKEGMEPTETEICTKKGLFQGACAGDSGGPLVSEDRKKQIGVVSYGTNICAIDYPDVFTRVSNFVDWINEQLSK